MVCSAAEVRSAVSGVKFLLTLPSILSDGQVLRGFAQSHSNADLFKLVQCCLFDELSVRLHPLFIECFILANIACCLAHSCTRFPCYLGMEIQTINAET